MAAISKLVPEFLRLFKIQLVDPKRKMNFDNHRYEHGIEVELMVGLSNLIMFGLLWKKDGHSEI